MAQGDSSRHLDRVTRGLTLPDPRPFLGEESHDPRGRGGNPWLDRGERTPASSTKIQGPRPPPSSSAGDRSDTPDPLPPVLRIQLRSSSDGDGPRSSPSPSPDLTSASKLQSPPATATASVPRTYSISSDQGLIPSDPPSPHIFSSVHAFAVPDVEPLDAYEFVFFLCTYQLYFLVFCLRVVSM